MKVNVVNAMPFSSGGRVGARAHALNRGSPVMKKRGRLEVIGGVPVDVTDTSTPSISVDRALDSAFSLGSSHVLPGLPWEDDAFLKSVMGPPGVPWLKPVKTMRSSSYMPKIEKSSLDQSLVDKKVDRVRLAVYDRMNSNEDDDRVAILMKWADLIMLCPEKSLAGKMLLNCADDEELVLRSLRDLFAKKATSTITTRAGSLALYFAWLNTKFPGEALLPIQEQRSTESSIAFAITEMPSTPSSSKRYAAAKLEFTKLTLISSMALTLSDCCSPNLGEATNKGPYF